MFVSRSHPLRPVDIEQLEALHRDKVDGVLEYELCYLIGNYREWHEANSNLILGRSTVEETSCGVTVD